MEVIYSMKRMLHFGMNVDCDVRCAIRDVMSPCVYAYALHSNVDDLRSYVYVLAACAYNLPSILPERHSGKSERERS